MQSICSRTGQPFEISPAEVEFCRKNEIPFPTLAPSERLRDLVYFRNRIFLYNTTCAFTNKSILSGIPPESGHVIYDIEAWESDAWDPLSYGRPYDFNRPFFDQFAEIFKAIPLPNLSTIRSTMENSDYVNGALWLKNCYLVFASVRSQDSLFSRSVIDCSSVVDCVMAHNCELCYSSRDIDHCYNLKYAESCIGCSDSAFLFNCQSCKNCFGCVNLQNKEYCFFNQQLTKEEYQKRIASLDTGSWSNVLKIQEKFDLFKQEFPIKYYRGKNNEESSGNYIIHSKNCQNSYFITKSQDIDHGVFLTNCKDSLFFITGVDSELCYNTCSGDNYNVKFCAECYGKVTNLEYCLWCTSATADSFGCIGLKKKSYCILNKQYTKEEYFELLPRVKEHMRSTGEYGQFFPQRLSPFFYNQCEAIDYFPLSRDEALQKGYKWHDENIEPMQDSYVIPDHIKEVDNTITSRLLVSKKTGKQYKIIKQELEFYRKVNVPLPRIAPLERIKQLSSILQVKPLMSQTCSKCQKPLETTYTGAPQPVLCEECYLKEVY